MFSFDQNLDFVLGVSLLWRAGSSCVDIVEAKSSCCDSQNLGAVVKERRAVRHHLHLVAPCSELIAAKCAARTQATVELLNEFHESEWKEDGETKKFVPSYTPEQFRGHPQFGDYLCPAQAEETLAITLGQPFSLNIFHALADAIFLARALQLTSAGAFTHFAKKVKVVVTKWSHAVWSKSEGKMLVQFTHADRGLDFWNDWLLPMGKLYFKVAFSYGAGLGYDIEFETVNSTEAACKRCFPATVQPWREFAGDGAFHNEFRRRVLAECGVFDVPTRPWRKKVLIVLRTRFARGWGNLQRLIEAIEREIPGDWEIRIAQMGNLSPCDQIKEVYDASVMIAIHGAEVEEKIEEKIILKSYQNSSKSHRNLRFSINFRSKLQFFFARNSKNIKFRFRSALVCFCLKWRH